MRNLMKIDSLPKGLSFLTGLGSLVLLVYGVYGEPYWSGLGLVLLMTSLMMIVGLSGPLMLVSTQDQRTPTRIIREVRWTYLPESERKSLMTQ